MCLQAADIDRALSPQHRVPSDNSRSPNVSGRRIPRWKTTPVRSLPDNSVQTGGRFSGILLPTPREFLPLDRETASRCVVRPVRCRRAARPGAARSRLWSASPDVAISLDSHTTISSPPHHHCTQSPWRGRVMVLCYSIASSNHSQNLFTAHNSAKSHAAGPQRPSTARLAPTGPSPPPPTRSARRRSARTR